MRYMTIFIVSLCFFMESIDGSVINTSIPSMAASLMVDPIHMKVALLSYLLTLAIFIPISGWAADKYGVRKVFIIALGIFTISSLWCGFAQNITELVIARSIQGLGGAFGLPVGRLIILQTFKQHEYITAMARVIIIGALGLLLGPVIGGFITQHFSWHWIFWINVPIGLITMILSRLYLIHITPKSVPALDKLGFGLFGLSMSGFTFSLSTFSDSSISPLFSWSILGISVALLIAYTMHSQRVAHPIVNTTLLKIRTFRLSFLGSLIVRVGIGGVPFLLPLLLQCSLHLTPENSGFLLAPMAIGVLIGKQFSTTPLRYLGFKYFLILNTLLLGLSIWSFTMITREVNYELIASLTLIYGCILSPQFTAMNSLAYAEINPDQLSSATSIMSTLQQLTASLGIAISALTIRLSTKLFANDSLLTPKVFHITFFITGGIVMAAIIAFIRLRPEDGHEMIAEK